MVKKPKDTTTTKRKTVYELVGERRPPFRRGVDPLDDILLDEERELSREVNRIRLEHIVMKRRQELERLKQQGGEMNMGSLPSNTDFLNMAKFMADLSPEEAQRVRSSYTFFKLAEKGGSGGMQLLPMLLNYAKTNPGASENQMINYLKLMDSQLVKGIEIAKAMTPQQSEDSAMKFLQLMKDLVIEGVRNPVLQAIEKSQPTPGIFDQILTNPDLWSRFKEIGMFGGSNAATSQFDLQIEALRGERQLSMKKLELELHKDNLQRQTEDRRTETLLAFFGPLAAALAGPASQKMYTLGQQQATAHNPTQTSLTPKPPPENFVNLRCSCGYEGVQPLTEPPQTEIICPKCEQVLTINIPETPPTEEKTADTPENPQTEEPEIDWQRR